MIDSAVFVEGRLEEAVDIVVLGDVAFDVRDSRTFFAQRFGCIAVDVSYDDFGSVLGEDLDCGVADASCAPSDHDDGVFQLGESRLGWGVVCHD